MFFYILLKITCFSGAVSVFAGSGEEGSSNGLGMKASFNGLSGIALDQRSGTLFVSDCDNHLIRKITRQGMLILRFSNITNTTA